MLRTRPRKDLLRSGAFRTAIAAVAGALLIAAAVWLVDDPATPGAAIEGSNAAPHAATALGDELARCQGLGAGALDDIGCRAAWAEHRRRFLGEADHPPAGTPSTVTPQPVEPEVR